MMRSKADSERGLKIASVLTGIYFIIEMGIGLYTGSIAVISDAFHTFSAVGGVLLAIFAGRLAEKPAGPERTFGYLRAEIIGSLLNGFFLLGMAFFVLWMGYNRLMSPIDLPPLPMLISAGGGLLTEIISIYYLYRGEEMNLNVRGAFWHILQTFVGSLIIIIAAVVIRFTGFLAIDPLLGMLFGVVLIYASYGIIKDSLNVLMELVPENIDIKRIQEDLKGINGVLDVHHIHAWTLTSGVNIFSTHILVNDFSRGQEILEEAHRFLMEDYEFYFSTVQIEMERTASSEAGTIDITQ
jgi:cobalt-zinc-cadmium efflux system protein